MGIKTNRQYLALTHFTVITDHRALQWLKLKTVTLESSLHDYNFTIKYKPGSTNIADSLSLLPAPLPCQVGLTTETIDAAHVQSGHGGLGATLHLLGTNDPTDAKHTAAVIKSCTTCQQYNPRSFRSPKIPVFSCGPFHRVIVDTVGPIQTSVAGNRFIIVAIDYFTRWTEAMATGDKSALTIANFLVQHIIFRHGAPAILQSDNGLEFDNAVIQNMCDILHTTKKFSSPYRPATNGAVERVNQTLVLKVAKISAADWRN